MADRDLKPENVIELGAHVPADVRDAAKAVYLSRQRAQDAQREHVANMRALSLALKRFGMSPSQIQVGELDGRSLVSACDWEDAHG